MAKRLTLALALLALLSAGWPESAAAGVDQMLLGRSDVNVELGGAEQRPTRNDVDLYGEARPLLRRDAAQGRPKVRPGFNGGGVQGGVPGGRSASAPVPEPSTGLLVLGAVGTLGLVAARRRRNA